jgi:phospholipid transport system substrate-binding protein
MFRLRAVVAALALCAIPALGATTDAAGDAPDGPMALTRKVLEQSNTIVRGGDDRTQKLHALSELLRGFLDTDALARLAAEKHLQNRSDEEVHEFLTLFHEFFVRTYVQRLLLFDAPNFTYGAEKIDGDTAHVSTEVVTPGDRFAVDYTLKKSSAGWRATDIVVEGVSLAKNFRSQFDAAVEKDSFQGLLDRLRAKVGGKGDPS